MSRATVPKLRKALKSKSPGTRFEQVCWSDGVQFVAGIDEVGRGAWAGPLTVAAAVIPRDRRIYKVRDSKMLKESERELLYDRIIDWVDAWGVGHASEVECDALGMSAAQKLAARHRSYRGGVRPFPDRWQLGLRWRLNNQDRQRRRQVLVDCGSIDHCQGHSRPADALDGWRASWVLLR
jgi:hypothetical protein